MVSINQVEVGLANWLDAELIPKLPTTGQYDPLKKVAIATGAMYAVKRGRKLLGRYEPMLSTIGLIEDGNIDLEGVRDELKRQMPVEGVPVSVPMVGELRFYRDDVDHMYNYIMGVKQ